MGFLLHHERSRIRLSQRFILHLSLEDSEQNNGGKMSAKKRDEKKATKEREREKRRVEPAGCRQRYRALAKRKQKGDRHLALLLSLGLGPILKWSRLSVFIALALLVAAAVAEPPRFRAPQRQYYFARQQEETTTADNAAYPPSGWRPAGPAFNLPQRQYGAPAAAPQQQYGAPAAPQQQYGAPAAPQQQYGAPAAPQQQYGAPAAPQQQYGAPAAPQQQYGAPSEPQSQYGPPKETTTTEAPTSTEGEDSTTVASITESESEPVNSVNELDDEEVDEQQPQQSGEYYVALPDGRLQRVRYVSRQYDEAMKYFAKIRAENVEPLRGPIYAYSPLQKLQILPAGLQVSVGPIAPVAAAPVESKPQKLEIQPVTTQVQYQYDNPAGVLPLSPAPVSSPYTAYANNYQVPVSEPRYLLALQ
ncbi:Zinc metalloprotease zmpB [Habropoda laboriosa]|uniref:Zinc metalloprotease zmpB n=1 Tax=Habropoda laboriosa TaxID=597456 RepID=A0A0L7REM0_9HYME|nr:Zinc metalloprotease zmpB [Habropoda laboriosa]